MVDKSCYLLWINFSIPLSTIFSGIYIPIHDEKLYPRYIPLGTYRGFNMKDIIKWQYPIEQINHILFLSGIVRSFPLVFLHP